MPRKKIFLENIGHVNLVKRKGTKRISIRVKPFSEVNVSIPYLVPFYQAERFVISKKEWIARSREKMKKIENQYTLFEPGKKYQVHHHQLELIPEQREDILVECKNARVLIKYPCKVSYQHQKIQEAARKGYTRALRLEAKHYLPKRVMALSKIHNLPVNKIQIRDAKTRWGSCSGKNNINLNLHLMRLPTELIDYVIVHELIHTVHRNHGKEFWKMLHQLTGNAKNLANEMKKYHTEVY